MNGTRNCASRLFLILALICASWVTTTVGQPPSTLARNGSGGGRLTVQRAANFGWNLAVHLQSDGRAVSNIVQGRRYDGFVPAGRHVLTVSAAPYVCIYCIMGLGQRRSSAINVAGHLAVLFSTVGENLCSLELRGRSSFECVCERKITKAPRDPGC